MKVPTVGEALDQICKRAGVKSSRDQLVEIIEGHQPPRLVHVATKYRSARPKRRVEVGREWLREEAPELAAAFIAARLQGER